MVRLSLLGKVGLVFGILGGVFGIGVSIYVDFLIFGRATFITYATLGVAVFMAIVFWFALRPLFAGAKLLKAGLPATATVLEVADTGMTLNQSAYGVRLKLHVMPPGRPAYETELRTFVSRLNPGAYQPGMQLNVRYDRNKPSRVVIEG